MAGASQAAFSLCSVLWGSLSMHAPTAPEMRTYHLAPFPFLRRLVACSAFALLLALCSHSVWAAADADADASASAPATAGIAVKAPTPAPANTNQIAPNAAPVASTAPAAAPVAPTAPAASAAAETAPAAPALTSGQKLGTGTIKSNSTNHQGELASGGLNSADGIIKWLLSTIAVLGVIFAFAYFLKRSRFVQRGAGPIVLENQIALGPKERVVQVKVGERHLLLGVTSNSVNLICDLTALDAKNAAGAASVDAASAAAASVASAASEAAAAAAAGNAPLMAGMNPAAPMPVQRNGLSPAMGADYAVYHQPSPYPYASYPYPPQAPQAPYAEHAPHDAQAPQAAQQGAPLAGGVGPNGVQFPAQAPVMPMPSPMSSPVPASLAGSAPIMQGMTAVEEEDEEPQFSRAGLPPLFPEDEPNYAKISPPQPQPPLMSAGQVPAGPVAAAPAMATPAAVAPAAALASDGEDTSLALQQNAVSAKSSKRSGAVRRNRNSRKSTRRLSTGTVLGANITAPPDDSVLRARAARAQRDRHLAEIAQELEREREREQDSDSFAAMLAHSYKQNCAISEDSVGNRAEHSAPVTSGAQVSEVEQGSSASPLTPVQGK